MKMDDVEEIQFSRDGFKPHVKSPIIWGRKGAMLAPLCYLTKPKSMSTEDWNTFLDRFDFTVQRNSTKTTLK